MSSFTRLIGSAHHRLIFLRRMHALTTTLAGLLPPGPILDVGAGNGMIGALLMEARSDLHIVGVDVVMRPQTAIPVAQYDGDHLPYADKQFAAVLLVDVLHHTDSPARVLGECMRVADAVVIKDHFYRNGVEHGILRGLDWVGNASHGVALPYNYFTRTAWANLLHELHLSEEKRIEAVPGLYPPPFQWVLGRKIQFVSCLVPHA